MLRVFKTTSVRYLKENIKDEVDFCLLINAKGFCKVTLSFYMCMARHAQIIQNKRLTISLQYLKKEVSNGGDFLHGDELESLLQIDTMILIRIVKRS